MAKEIVYKSVLAPFLEGFVSEKRACGFKYEVQAYILKRFDEYWLSQNCQETTLTIKNVEGWLKQRENENAGSLRNRINVTIEFAKYLNGLGYTSYIPMVESRYELPVRHIFTKPELTELYSQIDSYHPGGPHKEPFERMANEYPILFRVI